MQQRGPLAVGAAADQGADGVQRCRAVFEQVEAYGQHHVGVGQVEAGHLLEALRQAGLEENLAGRTAAVCVGT